MPERAYIVVGDDGGESTRRKPARRVLRVRNWLMDTASSTLWLFHLYGTCGAWDAWCDQHGRWDH